MSTKINRYPSIRAFEKNETSIFIGREKESKDLFNKVVAEKIVLLFARSGIGKSSLINAGLTPILEARGFFPIYIRLSTTGDQKDSPLQILKNQVDRYCDKNLLELLKQELNNPNASLWEYFKCCSFPLASIPVLIFDQFEQFFNFNIDEQNDFLSQLNELLTDSPPAHFQDKIIDLEDPIIRNKYNLWLSQPEIKSLFAIRSDKIFEMNRLTRLIPNILRNRFELYPLNEDEARKAITTPAAKKDPDKYTSAPFLYHKDLLDDIITQLKGGNNIIETTQLQIICSEIENRIVLDAVSIPNKNSQVLEVSLSDLEKIGGVKDFASNFYQNQIRNVGSIPEQELCKILIEDKMFDINGKSRRVVFRDEVQNILSVEKNILGLNQLDENLFINKLLNLRLIREDQRENRIFYEISHDYLLNAISESADAREAKRLSAVNAEYEKRNKILQRLKDQAEKFRNLIGWLAFVFLILGLIAFHYYNQAKVAKAKISTNIASILKYEGDNRYKIGEKILAHALWDSARYFNPTDPVFNDSINARLKLPFPPFSGNIELSDDLKYIGTLFNNSLFTLWEESAEDNKMKLIFKRNLIQDFKFISHDKLMVLDTGHLAYYYNLPNITSSGIELDSFRVSRIEFRKDLDLIKLYVYKNIGGQEKTYVQFYYGNNFKPVINLNEWLKDKEVVIKSLGPSKSRKSSLLGTHFINFSFKIDNYKFSRLNNENILVATLDKYYVYNLATDRFINESEFAYSRTGVITNANKIAYNENNILKFRDVLTNKVYNSLIRLKINEQLISFFNNGSILLTKAGSIEDVFLNYNLYNVNLNTKIKSFTAPDMINFEIDTASNLIFYTDANNNLIVYNVKLGDTVCVIQDINNFDLLSASNKVHLNYNRGKSMLLNISKNSKCNISGFNGVVPDDAYGEKFYHYTIPGLNFLTYQDSTKNRIENLRIMFSEYIDNEINEIIGN